MRVLVVATNQEQRPDPVVPLGALYVAGAARAAGHDVAVHDCCFDGDTFAERLAATIAAFRPEVVGVSLRNVDNVAWPQARSYLEHYRAVMATVRAAAPGVPVLLGGSAFTLFPEPYLDALAPDAGVAGEGEHAFVALLAAAARGEALPKLVRVSAGAGDLGGEPALDLVDLDRYFKLGGAANIQTRRGCPFSCTYCTYPELEGRKTRPRPVAEVVDQMARLKDERGVDYFFLVDNVFNVPVRHAEALCDELIARRLGVRWTAFLTPRGATPALLHKMAAAGCTGVDMGTDAGHPDTLRALGKPFGPDEIRAAAAGCHDAGLKFSHSLILGGPEETWETLRATVDLVEETRPTAVLGLLGVRLYKDTPLGRQAVAEGWVGPDEIGLAPLFHISPAVRDGLEAWATALQEEKPHWYFPGLAGERDRRERYLKAVRRRGAKGPLWELMGS